MALTTLCQEGLAIRKRIPLRPADPQAIKPDRPDPKGPDLTLKSRALVATIPTARQATTLFHRFYTDQSNVIGLLG